MGFGVRKRKDVDESAAHRELAGFFDKIDPLKVEFKEVLVQKIHVEACPHGDLHAAGVELSAGDDLLGQGLGVGNHGHRLASAQAVQHLGAQSDVGVVGLVPVGVGSAVGVRKKQHRTLREQLLKVVKKIGRFFFVAAHDHDRLLELGQG